MLKTLRLTIPKELIDEPIIYQIVTQYNLEPNIIEANFAAQKRGNVLLTLKGKPVDVESGILYLRELDIEVVEVVAVEEEILAR